MGQASISVCRQILIYGLTMFLLIYLDSVSLVTFVYLFCIHYY